VTSDETLREEVRSRYAEVARTVITLADTGGCCDPGPTSVSCFGGGLYGEAETDGLPAEAVRASLGCGNPLAVADLHTGERVLDLGSGGGIDVLLSARRVGPSGFAYGVDMTGEMLALARANAAQAGAANVEFLHGEIEALPLPDASVDVVISNCVINLSTDKPAVLAEMFRVLVPGGRIGVSDVVAEDHLSSADRATAGSHVGCIAGALSRAEYLDGLASAGFAGASVTFTHEVASGMHAAIIRAVKPSGVPGSEEDDRDAERDDGSAEPVVGVRAVTVDAPAPEQAHHHEDPAVGGVDAPEIGAGLQRRDDAVANQDDGAGQADRPGGTLPEPAPDQVAAANLGQASGDEQADTAHDVHAATPWVPDTCTLPTAERPLRVADFAQFFADAVHGVERPEPTRLRLELKLTPQAAAQAVELALAEMRCCSFFTFTLALELAVPSSYSEILDAMAATATRMTSAITSG
jgi:arsenite methyltransferase